MVTENHATVLERVILTTIKERADCGISEDGLFNGVVYHFHKETQELMPADEYEPVLEQMKIRGKVGYHMSEEGGKIKCNYFPAGLSLTTSTPSFLQNTIPSGSSDRTDF